MFSIIIPVYNKEEYIKRAINSVLNQTFPDFELIIVDDGSTDKSLMNIKTFEDKRIKILSQQNMGVSSARNVGILYSKKSLIAFLDADDTWHPQFLEKILTLYEKYPEVDVYYTNHQKVKIDQQTIKTESKNNFTIVEDYFKFSKKVKSICASSVVIKKKALNNVGSFPTNFKRGEDLYLWTKLAIYYQIAYTDFIGAYYYRDIPDSLTRKRMNIDNSLSNIAEDFFEKYKSEVINENTFREYMVSIIIFKVKYLVSNDRGKEARKLLKRHYQTKDNKKRVIQLYILSFMPRNLIRLILKN